MLWVEVANRTLEWMGRAERAEGAWVPRGVDPAVLAACAMSLRRAAAGLVLDPDTPLPADVSQWLAAVTLRPAAAERRGEFELPTLRARRRESPLPQDLEELLSTALVELAATRGRGAERCAGVGRFEMPALDPVLERGFARRARLEGILGDGAWQCPRWVAGPRAGQYCSKACANAAFALRKAAREPSYFARKQARYRSSKRRAAARVESAFAFVD